MLYPIKILLLYLEILNLYSIENYHEKSLIANWNVYKNYYKVY